jgi:nitrite reductase/ring-hydroxylating ferredoxin subunit
MGAAAGAGLIALGAGCGAEGDPRIETGGIDNQPFQPAGGGNPDMAHPPSVGNGSTSGGGGGTTGSTTTGGTTTSGTTTSGTTAGGTTTGGATTGGITTGGATTGGTTGSTTCSTTMVSAGAASAVAVGTAKRIQSGNLDAWLCRDSGGYYALDNYCPHRGCSVSFVSSGSFRCPCHGATFNLDGVQTNRESPQPMDHLSLCIDSSGTAHIDPQKTVDPTTRA